MARVVSILLSSVLLFTACATQGPSSTWFQRTPRVQAMVETDPVHTRADAADDAAIWIHPVDPGASLIVATDKQSGLLVYGLDGSERQYLPAGHTNNVDLRTGPWGKSDTTLVAASGRYPSELLLLTLDHRNGELRVQRRHAVKLREPYGICLYQDGNGLPYVFMNSTEGTMVQYAVDPDYGIKEVRRLRLRSQPEGCVADDAAGVLYIGEERRGIWRMSAKPDDPADLEMFDAVGNGHLIADVEGLALYDGEKKLLVASSQGNSSFAVYDLNTSRHLLSFRISGNGETDSVSDTDGVALTSVSLPGYPKGMLVVQDGYNTFPDANQNFKIVNWSDVLDIIGQE